MSRTAEKPGQAANVDLLFVPVTHQANLKLPAVSGSSGHLVIERQVEEGQEPSYPGQVFANPDLSYMEAMQSFINASAPISGPRKTEPPDEKPGKPILERSLTYSDPMLYGFKLGILAFDATRLCASNVDFPIDLLLYRRGSYHLVEHRFQREDLSQISSWWQERMRRAVDELPSAWVEAALSRLPEPLPKADTS